MYVSVLVADTCQPKSMRAMLTKCTKYDALTNLSGTRLLQCTFDQDNQQCMSACSLPHLYNPTTNQCERCSQSAPKYNTSTTVRIDCFNAPFDQDNQQCLSACRRPHLRTTVQISVRNVQLCLAV